MRNYYFKGSLLFSLMALLLLVALETSAQKSNYQRTENELKWSPVQGKTINPFSTNLKDTIRSRSKQKATFSGPLEGVIGGDNTSIENIPWQAYLGHCGATIISEYWLVTAAHCAPMVGATVRAGFTDRYTEEGQVRIIEQVIIHPEYEDAILGKDIALIKVSKPFDFSDPKVKPIAYATKADEEQGITDPCNMALVSGWGWVSIEGERPNKLQSVYVSIVANDLTEEAYEKAGYQAGWLTNEQLTAGDFSQQTCGNGNQDGGEDACVGDSGGPLVVKNAQGTGYVLAGIVSWGVGCAEPDFPGIYTRVSAFEDFIKQHTGVSNTPYQGLIISELASGSEEGHRPFFLEITNTTKNAQHALANLEIRLFADGDTEPKSVIPLADIELAAESSYVISAAAFDATWGGAYATATPNQINELLYQDNASTVQLFDSKTGTVIDQLGTIEEPTFNFDETVIYSRNGWVLSGNSGWFLNQHIGTDWTNSEYTHSAASPGIHTKASTSFDAAISEIVGFPTGYTLATCKSSYTVSPSILIKNLGTEAMGSLKVQVILDGDLAEKTLVFDKPIAPWQSLVYELEPIEISQVGKHEYKVRVVNSEDGNESNNQANVPFELIIYNETQAFRIITQTDNYSPIENYWQIKDLDGRIVAESARLPQYGLDSTGVCLGNGTYTFSFYDKYGDGFFPGFSKIETEDGTLIYTIDGRDPAYDIGDYDAPDLRFASYTFQVPFVASPDVSVNFISPASAEFNYTSCQNELLPKIEVTNTGNVFINRVKFNFGVGEASNELDFDNFILKQGEKKTFLLEPVRLNEGANTLQVGIMNVNKNDGDTDPSNNSGTATINYIQAAPEQFNKLNIELYTDSFFDQNLWYVSNTDGNIVAFGKAYEGNTKNTFEACLPDGDYTFTLFDKSGDGIYAGGVLLKSGKGAIITSMGASPAFEKSVEFGLPFTKSMDVKIEILADETLANIVNCFAYTHPVLRVTNTGESLISELELSCVITGTEVKETVKLQGALVPGQSALVVGLPKVDLAYGENSLTATLHSVNSVAEDDNAVNNAHVYEFTLEEDNTKTAVEGLLTFVYSPYTIGWEILDKDNQVVASVSPFTYPDKLANSTISIYECLPDGCYTFKLKDQSGAGNASITILVDGEEAASIDDKTEWNREIITTFCVGENQLYPINGLAAKLNSATEVELSWSYDHTADGFEVYRSVSQETGSYINVAKLAPDVQTFIDSDLQPQTRYHYSVVAKREPNELSIASHIVAQTGSSMVAEALFESFETESFPPRGWITVDQNEDHYDWEAYEHNPSAVTQDAFSGNFYATSASRDFFRAIEPDNWLITPLVNIASGYKLYYQIASVSSPIVGDSWGETYSVWVSTTDDLPKNFEMIFEETLTQYDWQSREIDLSAYEGKDVYISIRHFGGGGLARLRLDDVAVGIQESPQPAVASPSDLTAVSENPYSVTLEWEYDTDPDAFAVYVSTSGKMGTFTLLETLQGSARKFVHYNVEVGGQYYYQVSAINNDESSDAVFTHTTVQEFGFFEGFEGEVFPPTGWTMLDSDDDNHLWEIMDDEQIGEDVSYEGAKCAASASWIDAALTPDNWLITRSINIVDGDSLQYFVASQDIDYVNEKYSVLIGTDPSDPSSFTELFTETMEDADWHKRNINLQAYSGETVYIAFRHHESTDQFYIKLDNVEIINESGVVNQPPAIPTNLQAEATRFDKISLSWTDASDDEAAFIVQMATSEFGPWSTIETLEPNSANSQVENLTAETQYFFRMASLNDLGQRAWSDITSATTLSVISGLGDQSTERIRMYPNPAGHQVHVDLTEIAAANETVSIDIIDLKGTSVRRLNIKLENGIGIISLVAMPKGLYIVKVESQNGANTARLIIE